MPPLATGTRIQVCGTIDRGDSAGLAGLAGALGSPGRGHMACPAEDQPPRRRPARPLAHLPAGPGPARGRMYGRGARAPSDAPGGGAAPRDGDSTHESPAAGRRLMIHLRSVEISVRCPGASAWNLRRAKQHLFSASANIVVFDCRCWGLLQVVLAPACAVLRLDCCSPTLSLEAHSYTLTRFFGCAQCMN